MKNQQLKGFTLIEIITVLFVVSLGLIGVLSLIIQNIQSQSINRCNIIAYQLAQEGIELIRKTRDSNWVNGDIWNKNLISGSYYMDPLDSIPQVMSNFNQATLYKNDDGLYVHESGVTSTPYKRIIMIENLSAYSMRVYSRVVWSDRDKVFYYDLETLLYDWY
jgi:type II secretory pathway pseudopilin PulG